MWFTAFMDVFVTPTTLLIGLIGNTVSICVLRKTKEIQLRNAFARILIALAVFDIVFLIATGCLFALGNLSEGYQRHVYPYMVPIMLPVAQISMTASVYMTVVTCFDRYIAICRPAILSTLCCSGEEETSWCLIIGTGIFSLVYNFSRFFEYRVETCSSEESAVIWTVNDGILRLATTPNDTYWTTNPPSNQSFDYNEPRFDHNGSGIIRDIIPIIDPCHPNYECPCPLQTPLREDEGYVLYYLTISNGIFMGILPMALMIFFNILVVQEVNEANRKRARMTLRHQRNITITGLLVAVVIVFLICHSLKLLLNCYEVYRLLNEEQFPEEYHNTTNDQIAEDYPNYSNVAQYVSSTATTSQFYSNNSDTHGSYHEMIPNDDESLDEEPVSLEGTLEKISHWLLIVNSSCNIVIYLHKDPKFKEALTQMILSWIPMSSSARLRLMEGSRNNKNPSAEKSDGQDKKVDAYDDAEYGETCDLTNKTKMTNASRNDHVNTIQLKSTTICAKNNEENRPFQVDVV